MRTFEKEGHWYRVTQKGATEVCAVCKQLVTPKEGTRIGSPTAPLVHTYCRKDFIVGYDEENTPIFWGD